MSINKQVFKLLLNENRYKPICGDFFSMGRSTVGISRSDIAAILSEYKLATPKLRHIDDLTRHNNTKYNVLDSDLVLNVFPEVKSFLVGDSSDYEGADILIDLNKPLDQKLENSCDFIFDSGVLDNMFSPAQAISNYHKLLRPGGRICGLNISSFYPGAISALHPEWFFAFFASNNYQDAKIYVGIQTKIGNDVFDMTVDLFQYNPRYTPDPAYCRFSAATDINGIVYCYYIAEKGQSDRGEVVYPQNLHYIQSTEQDWVEKSKHFDDSPRPIIGDSCRRKDAKVKLPHNTDHYTFLTADF